MAKALVKIQRYFRRKPVRFFTLILLYLTAGSLVFLHAGIVGDSGPGRRGLRVYTVVASEMGSQMTSSDSGGLGIMRVFKEAHRPRRGYAPMWKQKAGQIKEGKTGDYPNKWSLAVKARNAKQMDDGRAKYIGCYVDATQKRALKGVSYFDYKKMTVFRCQDNCAERGYMYAGLEFGAECYCGHKIQTANASESECNMECKGEKSNMCGGANRLSIYRLELSQESARRYGSAIFKGCFRRPDNVTMALPFSIFIQNMSVDKCVDTCTEEEKSLAVLAGDRCHCGFPTPLFSLHEPEDEAMCLHRCLGEEFESCGNDEYFVAYQTQVQGFKGERDHWRSGRTICIKTHESGKKEIEAFHSSILMIRNPYKALMAEFNRKYGGHIGFASQAHWKGKEWPEFVKNYAPWWASHTLDWLHYGKNVHVVHFEALKRDLFSHLKGMVQFLGPKVSEERLLCVEGQKDGNFKRSGLRKLEYNPYTPEMQTNINELIRTVDAALKKRNMSGVPDEYMPR
ncbi:sialate:O-sulfotransferase 2 isoform X2 [Phyllopteryx taeniolatus]|uniref:sialate:O-sulfotransferase 2 isoform X2 n=1 Tax=Phyllopteryx taeniolatus TaxID=161469 RepID=UPI002AD23FA7|nr:sialate:O-sulfotransferase 2 isoform X2 [Phyllopteryx taeniolatus]